MSETKHVVRRTAPGPDHATTVTEDASPAVLSTRPRISRSIDTPTAASRPTSTSPADRGEAIERRIEAAESVATWATARCANAIGTLAERRRRPPAPPDLRSRPSSGNAHAAT
jgi:hypothetical protein